MHRLIKASAAIAAAAWLALPATAFAELQVGARAPEFRTTGALAGKDYAFDLEAALRQGPVVLYFYPKAFTKGCTLEAHAFADAEADFAKLGARVIGMSADDLPTLRKFSTQECRDKFPVAVASPAVIDAYKVALSAPGVSGVANRTSYVVAPNGRISFVYTDLDYRDHVTKTLAAVKALNAR